MGTIPTRAPFVPGAVLTATQLNELTAVDKFWAATPRCSCYQSAGTAVATSAGLTAGTACAFGSEIYDAANNYDGGGDSPHHDTVTLNTRLYFRTAGKYQIEGKVQHENNSTGDRVASIRLNAAGSYVGGTLLDQDTRRALNNGSASCMASVEYPVAVGDYVELFAAQNSGVTLTTQSGLGNTYLRAKLLSS